MGDMLDKIKPMVAICCGTCKHSDKKITDEPCMNCNAWCDKWEDKETNGEDNKM